MSEFDQEIDLQEVLDTVAKLSEEYTSAQDEFHEVQKQLDVAERLYQKLSIQKRELQRRMNEDRQALRQAEKEADRARRLADAKAKRDSLREDFEKRAAALDNLTATAKWREFAFDHQISGGKRLAVAQRGILADKRGLGKTLTSLIYLDMVDAKRILVLAPNDVVPQFEDEIRSWAPARTIFSLRGLNPDARSMIYPMLKIVKEFIITLNYEAWRKDKTIIDDLVEAGIDTIICDEAHKIKSSKKLTARGVFQIAYRPNFCATHKVSNYHGSWVQKGVPVDKSVVDGYNHTCPQCGMNLVSTVRNILCMTGTPILNKPQELFSMLHLVDGYRFPDERAFLSDYCYSYAPNRWKFLGGGLDRLTNSMSEFFVQRDRDQAGITIPPPKRTVYRLDKDLIKYSRQWKAEHDLRTAGAMVLENGDAVSMLYILEIILRERQIVTWPAGVVLKIREQNPNSDNFGEVIDEIRFDVDESQKLDEAMDLLNDLCEEGERTLVFSKFKAPLYEAHRRIVDAGYSGVVATGDQNDRLRDRIRADFDLKTAPENPNWQVMFATYDAFGTGVNLNAARHVIMLDYEWNPGMEDQAIGRIDRLNSTDQANVHIFHVNKSIDDFMENLLKEKREITEGFETEFSAKDYFNYLKKELN